MVRKTNYTKMGHDIKPIGNHHLNTENVKKLAEDICQRIDINIEYGYLGQKEHFKLLGENREDDFVILGKIIKHEKFKTFRLFDESYQLKELYSKFGDNLFYNPEYWIFYKGKLPKESLIEEEKKDLIHPHFELIVISSTETENLSIYKELYSNDIPYIMRWFSFCGLFTENCLSVIDDFPELLVYRKELMNYTLSFGGNKMYYLDDQSEVLKGVGQGDERELSWNNFENFVKATTADLMLNIPLFLTNINYRNEFVDKKEYPLSFVDDFSDIKLSAK